MALDLSRLKKNNPTPQSEPNVDTSNRTGIKLTLTEGKTYDLDTIISQKLRGNSSETLNLRTLVSEDIKEQFIEYVTKKILVDYGVDFINTNDKSNPFYYGNVVSKVPNFNTIFDIYFNKYYEAYLVEINSSSYEGSISIDTILRKISLTKEDIKKYTLLDVAESADTFMNVSDKNRPLVIWTDGTDDDGSCSGTESVLYRDEFVRDLYEALGTDSKFIDITETKDKINISLNGVASQEHQNALENKVDRAFDKIANLGDDIEDLRNKQVDISDVDINKTETILLDNNLSLQTDPNTIPTTNAVYGLFCDFFSSLGTSIKENGDFFSYVVSQYNKIIDTTLHISQFSKMISLGNNEYRLRDSGSPIAVAAGDNIEITEIQNNEYSLSL